MNDTPNAQGAPQLRPARDLTIVGAGILGLAHAAEAHERGLRVAVVDRDAWAVGASVQNFGHIGTTVQSGRALDLAVIARERWILLGEKAGFEVTHCGTVVVARSPIELGLLEEFAEARGTDQVVLLSAADVTRRTGIHGDDLAGGAFLPLDLRLDPRDAVPAIARWLGDEGVEIHWGLNVGSIEPGVVRTALGEIRTDHALLASGHDLDRLMPGLADEYGVRRCRLHMLQVVPPDKTTIEPAVLTGTSMLRYAGLSALPAANELRSQFETEQPELLEIDMNLMLTQRPDGSMVLGDSHQYARTHSPFDEEQVSDLILREGARLLGSPLRVRRRWRGVYAHSTSTDFVVAQPHDRVHVVAVTSGIGMTTAFGLAPGVLDQIASATPA